MHGKFRTAAVGLFVITGLTFIASINFCSVSVKCVDNHAILDELSGLPTHAEVQYLLYGVKPQSALRNLTMYDPLILRYIRTHVSRPTPGARRATVSQPPDQSTGNYNGVKRLPGDVSQSCQSTMIDRLLNGRRNGFFIEAGAFDGITLSNSWFFETQRNWTGLLVEGNPQLLRSVISLNRNAHVLRACVGTVQQPMLNQMWLNGGLSALVGAYSGAAWNSAPVICFPLNAIAAALGITHVDFLSLDVEGPELEILETIDWTRIRIDVIMLEYNNSAEKLTRLRRFFNSTGLYRETRILKSRVGFGLDVIFKRLDLEKKQNTNSIIVA